MLSNGIPLRPRQELHGLCSETLSQLMHLAPSIRYEDDGDVTVGNGDTTWYSKETDFKYLLIHCLIHIHTTFVRYLYICFLNILNIYIYNYIYIQYIYIYIYTIYIYIQYIYIYMCVCSGTRHAGTVFSGHQGRKCLPKVPFICSE